MYNRMTQLQYIFVERDMLGWPNSVDANGDDNDSDEVTHILALKQNTSVKVHLREKPFNPLDPSAIAIDLDYGTGSSHVGYIASELCKSYSHGNI